MRTSHILSATALAVTLAAGGLSSIAALARDQGSDARVEAKARLSIVEVHQRITALGYGDVESIERESGVYEVRARTRDGERVKLHVDASSGEIVRTKSAAADGAPRAERRNSEARGRAQNCTQRRCRDDRVQALDSEKLGWYLSDIYGRMKSAGL
jgi:hypothetical protein